MFENSSKIKVQFKKLLLVFTLIFYIIGIVFATFGTFSSAYSIKKVNFTTAISYNRAMENRDLLFNNVSILPDNLEIYTVSAFLLTPKSPKYTQLPGILWSHGMVVNKEYNLHNAMDLAAAGFVVLAIDLPGHGDSGGLWDFGLNELQAIWSGVEYLSSLENVNPEQISVMGHSNGGMAVTRAAIFDKTPLGTGGKIKAVGSIWCLTDLNDVLLNMIGTNVIDDPQWGGLLATFAGCPDGIITSEDVKRRSVIEFINETNIPNFYFMAGDDDGLTNLEIQFKLYQHVSNDSRVIEDLYQENQENTDFHINNSLNPYMSFENGRARKLSILTDQNHYDEILLSNNMDLMIDWIILSLNLNSNNHISRTQTSSIKIETIYSMRIYGGYFIIIGTLMLVIYLGVITAQKMFPNIAKEKPKYILISKNEKIQDLKQNNIKFYSQDGEDYFLNYFKNPENILHNWKDNSFYLLAILICLTMGMAVSWIFEAFFLHLWLMNIYIRQFIWTGFFLSILCLLVSFLNKNGHKFTKLINREKNGLTLMGFKNAILYVLAILGIPLIIYNTLASILLYPRILPRPLKLKLALEIFLVFIIIFIFYFSLEIISKTQLFSHHRNYVSWKGYIQEIIIKGLIIWILWLLAYILGGIFMNSKLKWMFLQGNSGTFIIVFIGIVTMSFQLLMAFLSVFFYQQTRNIFIVTFIQAILITLIITGKYVFIYSVV